MQNQNFKLLVLGATPVLTTGETAAGDVLCATVALSPGVPADFAGELVGVTVLDAAAQGAELDVVLLKSEVSLGAPNAAVDISDADAEEILRIQNVAVEDYTDLIGSQFADVECGRPLRITGHIDATNRLWLGLIDRTGGKTYAADSLKLRLYFRSDNPR